MIMDCRNFRLSIILKANLQSQNELRLLLRKEFLINSFLLFLVIYPLNKAFSYEYYFEIFDNDAIHNFKSTKSAVFSNRISTDEEKQDQDLQEQNNNVNGLERSLKSQEKQISDFEKLQKTNKDKENLEYKDRQKIDDFLKRQKRQDQMMKDFATKMKDNLDKLATDKKDEFKEALQKKLDNVDKDFEKNKKLLDELKELNDKIEQEDLMDKMDKFKQNVKKSNQKFRAVDRID